MPSDDVEYTTYKLKALTMNPNHNHHLLSIPLEIREKTYTHLFSTLFARTYKSPPNHTLAILQTCTKIHSEASSVLYQRTPLRFKIGHRQVVSSIPPPQATIARFQNIYFKIVKMSSTHPSYEFAIPIQSLTDALLKSPTYRKICFVECELEEYASGHSAQLLQSRLKSFANFETVIILFEGNVRKSEFPPEAVLDDDPRKEYNLYMQRMREEARQRECASLGDVDGMFRTLEGVLGKGEIFDGVEGSEALCARRLVFHPALHATRTQG